MPLLVHPSEPAVRQQLLQALPTRWRAVSWHLLLAGDKAWLDLSCRDETGCGIVIQVHSILALPALLSRERAQNGASFPPR